MSSIADLTIARSQAKTGIVDRSARVSPCPHGVVRRFCRLGCLWARKDAKPKQALVQRQVPSELKRRPQFIAGVVGCQSGFPDVLQEVDVAAATLIEGSSGILSGPCLVLPSSLTRPSLVLAPVGSPLREDDPDHRPRDRAGNAEHSDCNRYPDWCRRHGGDSRASRHGWERRRTRQPDGPDCEREAPQSNLHSASCISWTSRTSLKRNSRSSASSC
jgi:hypothetical protein